MATKDCSIEGCGKTVSARGWCGAHYMRWKRHGDPLAAVLRDRTGTRTCDRTNCTAKHYGLGLCRTHYERQTATDRGGAVLSNTAASHTTVERETAEQRKARLDALWAQIQARRQAA